MKGIKSSIRSRESDGYGSKGSKLFSLIFKNEAISITLIRISLLKGILNILKETIRKMLILGYLCTNNIGHFMIYQIKRAQTHSPFIK
jgi:uncharacterized phage-like protein YoqJ